MNFLTLLLLIEGRGTSSPSPAPPVVAALEPPLPGALQAAEVVAWARDEHPAFGDRLISAVHAVRLLSRIQHELMAEAHQRDSQYLMMRWGVALAADGANSLAVVGGGTSGGVPSTPSKSFYQGIRASAGALVQVINSIQNPDGIAATRAATNWATDGLSLRDVLANFAVDSLIGQVVRVVYATGSVQERRITSNTIDSIFWGVPLNPRADLTSLYGVFEVALVAPGYLGVQTAVPSTYDERGFLVRFDSNGTPYIDMARPIIIPVALGIPLPPNMGIPDEGDAVWADGTRQAIKIRPYADRRQWTRWRTAYIQGQKLYLNGTSDWSQVTSLDIPFIPVPPPVTRLDAYLMLPDSARSALVLGLAKEFGRRALALSAMTAADYQELKVMAENAAATWLNQVGGVGLARKKFISEVW